jgi:hypothetical protein
LSDSGKILFIEIEAHCILIVHIKLDIYISIIIIAVIIKKGSMFSYIYIFSRQTIGWSLGCYHHIIDYIVVRLYEPLNIQPYGVRVRVLTETVLFVCTNV